MSQRLRIIALSFLLIYMTEVYTARKCAKLDGSLSQCIIRVELRSWSRYGTLWTIIGFSFILLTVNLFRHPTPIKHGLALINL